MQTRTIAFTAFRNKIVRSCRYCRTLYTGPAHQRYCERCTRARARIPRRWKQLHLSTVLLLGGLLGAIGVANRVEQRSISISVPWYGCYCGHPENMYPYAYPEVKTTNGWPFDFLVECSFSDSKLETFTPESWKKRDKADMYIDSIPALSFNSLPAGMFRKWQCHKVIESSFELKCVVFDILAAALLLIASTILLEWAARRSDEIRMARALSSNRVLIGRAQ